MKIWISVGAAIAVAVLVGAFAGLSKTDPGEVAVVRNGGWFDNHQIREVVEPASGLVWVGMWSSLHSYPAQQRFYTMTADPQRGGRPGIDLAHAPSGDGVDMGIEATIYFRLNTDPDTMRHFDDLYGTRQFRASDTGDLLYAWDGVDGWNAFFDATVRPIIENGLRIQLNQVTCAELVSSCALVQNGAGGAPAGGPIVQTPGQNNTNIAKIEQAIDDNLPRNLTANLGGNFFQDIKFNLVRVSLPAPVQDAVTKAQAAFAAISEAQARVVQAQADADADKARQQGYDACPACAQIDMIKALPPGVTTYAPGAGFAVGAK
jgi:regulator of protease activity HflC (stomatin/prohibitin superfamily)